MSNGKGWRRVKRGGPCPICDKCDWCLVSTDGKAAICARIESAKRCGDAGWLHRLCDDRQHSLGRFVRSIRSDSGRATRQDLSQLAITCQATLDPGRLYQLARSLGLSIDSLLKLTIGWSTEHRGWTFPMHNACGQVVGIRLRP